METVRRRVRDLGNDVAAVLQFIADCALSLTESSGAASRFSRGDQMTCRCEPGTSAAVGALWTQDKASRENAFAAAVLYGARIQATIRVSIPTLPLLGHWLAHGRSVVSDFRSRVCWTVFSPHPVVLRSPRMVLDQLVEMIPRPSSDAPVESAQSGSRIQPDDVSVAAEARSVNSSSGEAESTSKSATRTVLQENRTEVGEQVSRPFQLQTSWFKSRSPLPQLRRALLYRRCSGCPLPWQ